MQAMRMMRWSVILVAGAARVGAAQRPIHAYQPDSSPPRRIRFTGSIDVPLVPQAGRGLATPMIDVMVNGRGPYHFLIETGARLIGVSRVIADSIGLPRMASPDSDPEFHIDSISVGDGVFSDLNAEALPFSFPGIDGVLGLPFYQQLLLTIDYANHRARFVHDTLPPANGRDILALTRVGDFWGIPLTIAGTAATAVLDTQNSGTIGVPPSVADQLHFAGGLQDVGKARGAFGVVDLQGGTLDGDIAIGRYTLAAPFLVVMALPPDYPDRPNVGNGVLRNFVLSLDQVHGRLRLERSGSDTLPAITPPRRPSPPG